MIFSETLLLNESGLFDFDFTFVIESIEFILFSLVVTFCFISPISKQLDERAEFINTTLRKSTLLLTFGYEKLTTAVGLVTSEITELTRQLKGDLSIKSAYLFSNITSELNSLTNNFFTKKFKS